MKENLLDAFEAILVEELEVLDQLIGCLQKEREAIIGFDLKAITAAYKSKHQKIAHLETIETSRRDVLRNIGSLETSLSALEKKNAAGALQVQRIRHQLSCLRSISQAAQEFNQIQRHYISHTLANVQTSLNLMEHIQGNLPCYNERGENYGQDARVMSHNV